MIFNMINTLFTLFLLVFAQAYNINDITIHCWGKRTKASSTITKEAQFLNINLVLFGGKFTLQTTIVCCFHYFYGLSYDYTSLKYSPFLPPLTIISIDLYQFSTIGLFGMDQAFISHLRNKRYLYCFFCDFKILSTAKPHHCATDICYSLNSFKAAHSDILYYSFWFLI